LFLLSGISQKFPGVKGFSLGCRLRPRASQSRVLPLITGPLNAPGTPLALAVWMLLFLCLGVGSFPALAQDRWEEARERLAHVRQDRSMQQALPEGTPRQAPDAEYDPFPFDLPDLPIPTAPTDSLGSWLSADFIELLGYAAAIGISLWLLFLFSSLVRGAWRDRRRSAAQTTGEGVVSGPSSAAEALAKADALASKGDYPAALRLLLTFALRRLTDRRGRPLRHSLTGREVLKYPLSQEILGRLRPLVRAQEAHHFAGEPLNADRYQSYRALYQALESDFLPDNGRVPGETHEGAR